MQCCVLPWINLFNTYVGRYSQAEHDRAFQAFAGVCPEVAEFVFLKYKHNTELPNRFAVLLVLHFLKTMPSEDNASRLFGLCRKTYCDKLWRGITHLNLVMKEVVNSFFQLSFSLISTFLCFIPIISFLSPLWLMSSLFLFLLSSIY